MNVEVRLSVDGDGLVEAILSNGELVREVLENVESGELVSSLRKRGVPIDPVLEDEDREELLGFIREAMLSEGEPFVNQLDQLSSGVFIRTEIDLRKGRHVIEVYIADQNGAHCFDVDTETLSMVIKMAISMRCHFIEKNSPRNNNKTTRQ